MGRVIFLGVGRREPVKLELVTNESDEPETPSNVIEMSRYMNPPFTKE